MPLRHAEATWKGDLKSGQGWLKSETGSVEGTYSASSRFEDGKGTNPEELLGAAHAGCFSMALSLMLSEQGYKPEAVDTNAAVRLEKQDSGYAITAITLSTKCDVPGIDRETFLSIAEKAKSGCPVSRALAVPISLEAELVSH
jgi:osmotically inducible protein OsmC